MNRPNRHSELYHKFVCVGDKLKSKEESKTLLSPQTDSDEPADVDFNRRLSIPVIRGGLNSNISDILEASGYGTETDIRIDDDFRFDKYCIILYIIYFQYSVIFRVFTLKAIISSLNLLYCFH